MAWDFDASPFRTEPAAGSSPVPERTWSGGDLSVLLQIDVHHRPFLRVPGLDLDGESVWVADVEPGYPAVDLWDRLRRLYPVTGFWPIIATSDTLENVGTADSMCTVPTGTTEFDGDSRTWLIDRLTRVQRGGDDTDAFPRGEQDWSEAVFDRVGEDFRSFGWTDIWEAVGYTYHRMLLVPVARPWLVPGRLGWMGACNYDLGWRDHATILRRWQTLWRVELVALDRDVMWLRHLEPITERASALEAALEAALYCPDAIDEVPYDEEATLDRLAKTLLQPMWRLWWD